MRRKRAPVLEVASLFSGIGGIELGLALAGAAKATSFCESWDPARTVLRKQFKRIPIGEDVTELDDFDGAAMVTAGFPCTDLSQAGLMKGLDGANSGLVIGVLRLITDQRPDWVLLENVPNMLHLARGDAMTRIVASLEAAGYRWAYRVVDSRFTGLAQRRRRVLLLASRVQDPSRILLGEDAGQAEPEGRATAFGFSWTEGNRGLGWAQGATPTLKGGTTVSVPSPPAVWLPEAPPGGQIVRPSIEVAERLQGFAAGWTSAAADRDRWKLVGNAVSVPVARWLGERLVERGQLCEPVEGGASMSSSDRWPTAAMGSTDGRWRVSVSEFPRVPRADQVQNLSVLLTEYGSAPLSFRATRGFRDRLVKSNLNYEASFRQALDVHIDLQGDLARTS